MNVALPNPRAKVPDTSNFFTRILSVALAKVTVKPEPIVIEESSDGMTPLAHVVGSSNAPDLMTTKINEEGTVGLPDGVVMPPDTPPDIPVVTPPDTVVCEASSNGAERHVLQ